MERIYQKAQMLGVNTTTEINSLFRQKVQLEDQLKDVESQIHYARGVLDSVSELQSFIRETQKQDEKQAEYEQGLNTQVDLNSGSNLNA